MPGPPSRSCRSMSRSRRSTARCSRRRPISATARCSASCGSPCRSRCRGDRGGLIVFIPTVGDYVTPRSSAASGIMIGNLIQSHVRQGEQLAAGRRTLAVVMMMTVTLGRLPRSRRHAATAARSAGAWRHEGRTRLGLSAYAILYIVFLYVPGSAAAAVLVQQRHLRRLPAQGLHVGLVQRDGCEQRSCSGLAADEPEVSASRWPS